jgi:preprotein translocase subunit YajC
MPNLFLPFRLLQDGGPPAGSPAGSTGAGDAPAAQPGVLESLLGSMMFPLILCFGVFWLLILRPESKQRKRRQAMLAALQKGDRVQTNGGLYGSVVQVQDQVVTLQVDEGVRLKFHLSAIGAVVDEDGKPVTERKT